MPGRLHFLFHHEFLLPPNSFASSKVFLMTSNQILRVFICFPSRLNQKIPIFLFIAADINGTLAPFPGIRFCPFGYTEDCHSSITALGGAV